MDSATSTLVGVSEVKTHLALLHAFANLKSHIENLENEAFPYYIPRSNEQKWGWFVGLAVERYVLYIKFFSAATENGTRFDSWCKALQQEDLLMSVSSVLPPIDVIMVTSDFLSCIGVF
jgi:hypothetical protein